MNRTTIQVQIVTYNSSATIEDCLNSVINQTVTIDNIIVFDNASDDDTVEQIEHSFPAVTVKKNNRNLGYSKAHNIAFDQLTCDLVLTLNPDVILEPDYIEKIRNVAIDCPIVGAFTGKLLSITTDRVGKHTIDTTGIVMNRTRRAYDRYQGECEDQVPILTEYVFAACGAAAIYRKEMLLDIKLGHEYFDEDFFSYKEDIDLCWRAQLLGWKCMYVDSAIGYHERGWKSNNRNQIKPEVRMHSMKNRYLMMLKNDAPTLVDWLYILPVEAMMLLYGILFDRQLFRSYLEIFRLYRKMIDKRKHINKKIIKKRGSIERITFR